MSRKTKNNFIMKKLFLVFFVIINLASFADNNEDLFSAIAKGDATKVKTLLDAGADANAVNKDGLTVLGASYFWPEISKMLLEKGADPNKGKSLPLILACQMSSSEVVKLLIAKGADVNKMVSTEFDAMASTRTLLEAEKAKGKAANKIMIDVYENMLKNAKPVTINNSPLQAAIASGCKECFEALVAANVDMKSSFPNGDSYLDIYITSARGPSILANWAVGVKAFENYGATVPDWYRNRTKESFSNLNDILVTLIQKGGLDIKAPSKSSTGFSKGKSFLMIGLGYMGISASETDALIALVKNGADVNEKDEKWGTALNLAVRKGNLDLVKAMVEAGADVNVETKEYDEKAMQYVKGFTPLTLAAMIDKKEIVEFLLPKSKPSEGVYGFSANIKTGCLTTVEGKTAIFFAIENNNLDMVKTLVENSTFNWSGKKFKVDQWKQKSSIDMGFVVQTTIKCLDDGKFSPLEYAKEYKYDTIVDYLKSKGVK